MTSRSIRVIKGALLSKGFLEESAKKHKKLRLWVDNNRTEINTFYSHSAKECDDYILDSIAGHLKLSKIQLINLIDCTLSKEEYVKILKEKYNLEI